MRRMLKVVAAVVLVAALLAVSLGTVAAAGPRWGTGDQTGVRTQGGPPPWARTASHEAVSDLLGIDEQTLVAERQAGKSLAQIAADRGMSEEQLVEAILASKKAALDSLVADGTLTQEQADLMYSNMQERVSASVGRTEVGPADGARMGRGAGSGWRANGEGGYGPGTGVCPNGFGGGMMRGWGASL